MIILLDKQGLASNWRARRFKVRRRRALDLAPHKPGRRAPPGHAESISMHGEWLGAKNERLAAANPACMATPTSTIVRIWLRGN